MKKSKSKRTTKHAAHKKSINLLALLLVLVMAFLCCPISAAAADKPSETANTFEELPGGVASPSTEVHPPTVEESELSEEDMLAETTASSGSGTNIAEDGYVYIEQRSCKTVSLRFGVC